MGGKGLIHIVEISYIFSLDIKNLLDNTELYALCYLTHDSSNVFLQQLSSDENEKETSPGMKLQIH